MRRRDPIGRLLTALSGAALSAVLLAPASAVAQVTMDNSALDALRKPEPHRAPRRPAPTRPAPRRPSTQASPTQAAPTQATTQPSAPAGPAPIPAAPVPPPVAAKPAIPAAPPAIANLPPPVVVPVEHPLPPPPIPFADDAPGAATPIAGGLRVTFGPERADLNPATVAALRAFAQAHAGQPGTSININAYATGSVEDPSTPRRLSLERALAARAVLLSEGIPSPRIYPRALGPTGGSTDPDRIDVITGSPTPPAATLPIAPARGSPG